MNDEQLDALFAAARQAKPDTARAELAFETRLRARLRTHPPASLPWFMWSWRLLPLLAGVVIGLSLWTLVSPRSSVSELANNDDETILVALLTGGE